MIVKEHKSLDGRIIVAVCDDNLIGKKFEEKKLQLDLSSNFYKGDIKSREGVLEAFKKADIVNLVGKEAVTLALEAGVISKDKILKIKGIPHAQALLR